MCRLPSPPAPAPSTPSPKLTPSLPPSAYVYGTGAAFGNRYTTDEVLRALIRQRAGKDGGDAGSSFDVDFAARVLTKCGFDLHSFVLPLEDLFRRFTREEYLELRRVHLAGLAERAGRQALERWGGRLGDITHLFFGTMTGALDSPTIDIALTKRLGLDLDVERTNIEGMGWCVCHCILASAFGCVFTLLVPFNLTTTMNLPSRETALQDSAC